MLPIHNCGSTSTHTNKLEQKKKTKRFVLCASVAWVGRTQSCARSSNSTKCPDCMQQPLKQCVQRPPMQKRTHVRAHVRTHVRTRHDMRALLAADLILLEIQLNNQPLSWGGNSGGRGGGRGWLWCVCVCWVLDLVGFFTFVLLGLQQQQNIKILFNTYTFPKVL